MSCVNCEPKPNDKDKHAQQLANETGEWVAVYKDEFGEEQMVQVSYLEGRQPIRYFSPKL